MPKSLALQRSERTALAVVRPLWLFRVMLWPAIVVLNGIGNWLLKLCGLQPGTAEEALHSPEELKLLIAASQEAGLLQRAQQQLVERVLSIGNRRITDTMTPRVDLEWIDVEDTPEETLKTIRECRHEQLLVGKAGIDEPLGMVLKKDLLADSGDLPAQFSKPSALVSDRPDNEYFPLSADNVDGGVETAHVRSDRHCCSPDLPVSAYWKVSTCPLLRHRYYIDW